MKIWTASFPGSFNILSGKKVLPLKKMGKLRDEVLQMFVETSQNKLSFSPKKALYNFPK